MIVTPIQFSPDAIRGVTATDDSLPPRSPGLHLSQIYYDIQATVDRPDENDMGEYELQCYRAGGLLWERVFSAAMAEEFRQGDIVRPGEFFVDGIIGSPDNVRVVTDHYRVIETKCTWKSARKFDNLEKYFWVWLVQMKGYCRMAGTQEAELYAFFVMGDYRGSGPIPKALHFMWTKHEIEENWTMLKNHARKRGWL